MYIFVNTDLKMKQDDIIIQVGHAVQIVTESIIRDAYEKDSSSDTYKNYMHWKMNSHPKIVLKAKTEQLKELIKLGNCHHVISETDNIAVLAFYPNALDSESCKKYKLL